MCGKGRGTDKGKCGRLAAQRQERQSPGAHNCRCASRSRISSTLAFMHLQAMALPHQDCIEVACNLLDHNITSPDAVLQRIEQLAAQEGLKVGEAYRISKSPEEIEQLASDLLAGGNADHSA